MSWHIELLHDLCITYSYDQVIRIKCSAAHAVTKSKETIHLRSDAGFVKW